MIMENINNMIPEFESISGTFLASVRSVGTACTMAIVGVYLHQRGFVDSNGKRTLALISQQVTFPLFLFTKIIYCNQDWSNNPCPDVTRSLSDVWMLLFWPIYVVSIGILIGVVVSKLTNTPKHQYRSVLAACGFGNSTGLPITLLTVVHRNFPSTSDLGRIDPTLFLSVYLLLYPVLQWGIGGWMLAPDDDIDQQQQQQQQRHAVPSTRQASARNIMSESLRHNVLNNKVQDGYYRQHRRGLSSADEGLYMTEIDLTALLEQEEKREKAAAAAMGVECDESYSSNADNYQSIFPINSTSKPNSARNVASGMETDKLLAKSERSNASYGTQNDVFDAETLWQSIHNILDRCFQPPVIGAVVGIIFAITPIRGIFVDLVDRDSSAPLQFLFDGLYAVGQAAVPINMMILGCNLSASYNKGDVSKDITSKETGLLSMQTMIGIVIGKMVIMPFVGISTGWILKNFFWDIPSDIDGSFYLVLMIVFLTPTANNVMVMVELSGSGAKEGIARAIALQYAVAPIILSFSMTVAIGVASEWS